MEDRELLDLIPLLEKLSQVDSVYAVLKNKEQVQQLQQQGNNSSLKKSNSSSRSSHQGTSATAGVTWWRHQVYTEKKPYLVTLCITILSVYSYVCEEKLELACN